MHWILSDEEILDTFFEKDKYSISKKDIKLKINPDHLKGTVSDFDIKVGRKLIVGKGNMVNVGHLKQLKNSGEEGCLLNCPSRTPRR